MNKAITIKKLKANPPSLFQRIFSVWYRHVRVYAKNFISNAFPPFLEPLIFLAGLSLGLGTYVGFIDKVPYVVFLATGILVPPAMYTAAFECSFGTFIRLEFDKVYDGMISASITTKDLLVGEMLFAATKGFFFTGAVLFVVSIFGLMPTPFALLAPIGGFLTGLMFAALSLFVTSFVTNINHFNFYFTGLLTPMFFFSGLVFPIENLPKFLMPVIYALPLTHSVKIVRAMCFNTYDITLLYSFLYVIAFVLIFGYLAIRGLDKRITV